MSDTLNAKSYLALLKRSGIVTEDNLRASLARLSSAVNGTKVTLSLLSDHLISEGLLTTWQNEQLRSGRHKGFFLGQYRLLRLLGAGGMSAVYLAEHNITGQQRAIKVLPRSRVANKSYLERFYLEGRAAAALRHPRIGQIVDLANDDDIHYMVMEFVDGIDLDKYVKEHRPLPILKALDYLQQTAEGLAHAHSRNIIHRDIKPANLMVTDNGDSIKLLDLGLALFSDSEESLTVLHDEKVMGTADYLPPEQALDSHRVDQRADIYSLGCTFYFMIVGHPPFPDGTIAQRVAKHQNAEPMDLTTLRRDCPILVWRLCQKMIKKKPEERFASCEVLLEAVKKVRTVLELQKNTTQTPPLNTNARIDTNLPVNTIAPKAQSKAQTVATPIEPQDAKPQLGSSDRSQTHVAGKQQRDSLNLGGLGDMEIAPAKESLDRSLSDMNMEQVASVGDAVNTRRSRLVKKSNVKSLSIVGAIVALMFVVLLVVLYFLQKTLD